MKKKEVVRVFNFSDAVLVTKGKEKVAFMRRDLGEFAQFGILETNINQLVTSLDLFANEITDLEAVGDQTTITTLKDAKAEELRVAIRAIMTRVELQFKTNTSTYRKFGTEALAQQSDPELLITGRRLVRVGNTLLTELAPNGVTPALFTQITALCLDFENLIIDMKIKIGERDVLQEQRVEMANGIYTTLASYAKTGQSIWETSNVAKYNDYVIYNTSTGEAPVVSPIL